jgi:WD40 repeat protein/uncharacterized caspase-like protein
MVYIKQILRLAGTLFILCGAMTTNVEGAMAQTSLPIEIIPSVFHSDGLEKVAFSAGGARAISLGAEHVVKVWDTSTGRLVRTFSGHVNAALSPDGRRLLATGEGGSQMQMWDVETGNLLRTFAQHSSEISFVAFSPDGSRVLSGGSDGTNLSDAATGKLLHTFSPSVKAFNPSSVAFAFNGIRILSDDGSLWDEATGQLLRTFPSGALLSSDGARAVSASGAEFRVLDTATGRVLHRLSGSRAPLRNSIWEINFSPDNTQIISSGADAVRVWNTETGRLLSVLPYPSDTDTKVALSPDRTEALINDSLWDVASKRLLRKLGGGLRAVSSLAFSPDGKTVLSGGGDGLRLWDAVNGRLVTTLKGHPNEEVSVSFSPDSRFILSAGGEDNTIKMWDATTGKLDRTFKVAPNRAPGHGPQSAGANMAAFSPDGKLVLSGSAKPKLWDAASGKLVRTFVDKGWANGIVAFSPDGSHFVTHAPWDNEIKLLDLANGRVIRTFPSMEPVSLAVSSDGARILSAASMDGVITVLDIESGVLLRTFQAVTRSRVYLKDAAFSPDGTRMLSTSGRTTENIYDMVDNSIKLWNVATGQIIREFESHTPPGLVRFSPDGKRVLSGSADSAIKIWNLATGELLLTFVGAGDNEWLAVTPEGFFTASNKGANYLSVVRGLEVFSIDQFYQSLYRPDLVREKLAGDPTGLVREAAEKLDLAAVLASGNAPDVRVVSPREGDRATGTQLGVEIEISDRGGGIGRVEWRVNGITVGVDTSSTTPIAGQSLRLARTLALAGGDNTIEIVAYNGVNLIASAPARVTVAAPLAAAVSARTPGAPGPARAPTSAPAAPRLFVLAAGADNYADKRFRLAFSVPDAKAIAQAFVDSGKGLYSSVEVEVMSDAEVTRDKLDAAFTELSRRVQPSDVFVLYLAGHGKTVDGRYYFAPQDFKVEGTLTKRAIDAAVTTQGIAQEQWQRWFALVPARRSVILFDTCESGTLTADESETKALERGAANDRLAQATGRSIITATSGSTEAFEGYRGHGLFTYNVLDALDRGDGDNSGTIEVTELAAYVHAQVTAISERVFRRRQEPQMKLASNYVLTRQTRVLHDDSPAIAVDIKPTHQLSQTAQVQILPSNEATVVRSLSAKSPVTVIKSEGGWSLVASHGKLLGYVATRDLALIR